MAESEVRVRFAPSPTGHLHVGGARTALFNWLFARNRGGKFILRIEDTDLERSTEESYRAIIDALTWLGLDWDEGPVVGGDFGPYLQSERRHLYKEWSQRLLDAGTAYYCFCSPQMLADMREDLRQQGKDPKYDGRCKLLLPDNVGHRLAEGQPHVIRFKMPQEGDTVIQDVVRGEVTFHNPQLDDFVLIKSDGYPTYNFAVTVDDALMKITHVIRGEDHLSNTPKQIRLCDALGITPPRYAHVPLILGPDKTRLSKRHGATAVGQFKEDGYLPEAVVNYLVLLGWAYDDKTELFDQDELISRFSLEKVSSTAAVFDYPKLQWMNAEYMKHRPLDEKIDLVIPHLVKAGLMTGPVDQEARQFIGEVLEVVGERLKVANQVADHAAFIFKEDIDYDPEATEKFLRQHYVGPAFRILEERLSKLDPFDASTVEPVMRGLVSEMGMKARDLFQPVRIALTGSRHSPGLFEVMTLLGKEKVLRRLEHARKTFV